MTNFDTDDFLRLSNQIILSGKALPHWLEQALLKVKDEERERLAFDKQMIEDAQARTKPFESRINSLFENFDISLPVEYFRFKTPELESTLQSTQDNIKQFAFEIQQLSKQAGENPIIENQAVKITANLLDRLKEDLGFSQEENKQLENKSVEEIAEYYSKTRTDKTGKLNDSINQYREEINQLEKQTIGKSKDELTEIYQDKLREIEEQTKDNRGDVKIYFDKEKYRVQSINDVKIPLKTEETMKNLSDKKVLLDINL